MFSSASKRAYGAWFHLPEFYIVYMAGMLAYTMISSTSSSSV
jgi:hypothetical protein